MFLGASPKLPISPRTGGLIVGSIGSGKARCRNDLAIILRPPVEVHNGEKVSSFHQRSVRQRQAPRPWNRLLAIHSVGDCPVDWVKMRLNAVELS